MSEGRIDALEEMLSDSVDGHDEARGELHRFVSMAGVAKVNDLSNIAINLGQRSERLRAAKILEQAITFWEKHGESTKDIYKSDGGPYHLASLVLRSVSIAISREEELELPQQDADTVTTVVEREDRRDSDPPMRTYIRHLTIEQQCEYIVGEMEEDEAWDAGQLIALLNKRFVDVEEYHVEALIKIMAGRGLIEFVGIGTDFTLCDGVKKNTETGVNKPSEGNRDHLVDSIARLMAKSGPQDRWELDDIAYGLEEIYPVLPKVTLERMVNVMVGRGLLVRLPHGTAGSIVEMPKPLVVTLAKGALDELGIEEEQDETLQQKIELLLRSNRDELGNCTSWSVNRVFYALDGKYRQEEIEALLLGIDQCELQEDGKYRIVTEEEKLMKRLFGIILRDGTRAWTQHDFISTLTKTEERLLEENSEEEVVMMVDESLRRLVKNGQVELISPADPWPKEHRWRLQS